jgi:hypothetical protein
VKQSIVFIFFILIFVSTANADDNSQKKNILVSVGDLKENNNIYWKKLTCDQIYKSANGVIDQGVNVTCRNFDTKNFKDSSLDDMYSKYDYHLRVIRDQSNTISIDVTNLNRPNSSDFKTLGWNFKDGEQNKMTKELAMTKALSNFFFYINNEKAFKAGLLVNGIDESNEVEYDRENGVFKSKFTHEPLSINKAYSIYEGESDRKKNYLRAGVEIGVLLSSAMAIYYKNLVFNQVDFDYSFTDGLKKKFNGEAIRYDDNDKKSNYGHVYAGVLYYQVARSNGFNSLESFLAAFASSTAWEFMEYHEVLSINDQILTPIGGYVIGEATYQISCALLQKNNLVAKTLGYTINPGLAANHGYDKLKNGNKFASQPDCNKPRWSDISIYLGLDSGQKAYIPNENTNSMIGMDATVVPIAGYGEEGKNSKLIYDTAMAKAFIEANGNQGLTDLRVIAQVMTVAYNQKNITKDEDGKLRGYDLLLGVGSASTWNDRGGSTENDKKNEDFYGTIGIIGAMASANVFYNGIHIKADFAFYGDFVMVKSYSIEKFKNSSANGLEGEPTTFTKHNYYWGIGSSTLAAISIQKGKWEVGYNGQYSSAKSTTGLHRLEEEVTRNDQFRDTMNNNKIYISYQLTKNVKLQLSREYNLRIASVNNDFHSSGVETRTMGTIVYKF